MNPRTEAAAQAMEASTRDISDLVRPLPRYLLVWRPLDEVWSILDNLAHIEEFVPFWTGEVQAMLAQPPQPWGRDQTHPGRLAAVRDTSQRDAETLLASVAEKVASTCVYLRTLNDSCLGVEVESRNPRWAVQPLDFVVHTLLVKHLSDRRGQIERNLRQAAAAGIR